MNKAVFHKVRASLCEASGDRRESSNDAGSGATTFGVYVDGIKTIVCVMPHRPESIQIIATLADADECEPSAANELAQANAWLLTDEGDAVICRKPGNREYAVCVAVPVRSDGDDRRVLVVIKSLAAAICRMRTDVLGLPAIRSVKATGAAGLSHE
jgi:hypothetical protein